MADLSSTISGNMLLERTTLSAPQAPNETRIQSTAILVVSVLSIIGAGWIVLSFCLFKQVRTFRHQLILGLAISDFWMAVNFLSSCAMNLSANFLSEPPQKEFCSFNGFMTQLFVVQTDYWVLTIAVCTYLILGNHKHLSSWIQEHRIVLWTVPWGLSSLWAALGLGLAGYGDIGAWCWFTSDKVRLLVNFIPRWLIIILILGLYARLYRLIYKAHNRFMSFNDEMSPRTFEAEPDVESMASTRRISRPSLSAHLPPTNDSNITTTQPRSLDPDLSTSAAGGRTHIRQPSPLLKKMAYQMMSYPLVYMFIWTIPTTIRIYQSVTSKPAPFGIATVDKACIVVQGFADAIIYGVSESSLGAWRERFGRGEYGAERGVEGGMAMGGIQMEVKVDVRHEVRVERAGSGSVDGDESVDKVIGCDAVRDVWKG